MTQPRLLALVSMSWQEKEDPILLSLWQYPGHFKMCSLMDLINFPGVHYPQSGSFLNVNGVCFQLCWKWPFPAFALYSPSSPEERKRPWLIMSPGIYMWVSWGLNARSKLSTCVCSTAKGLRVEQPHRQLRMDSASSLVLMLFFCRAGHAWCLCTASSLIGQQLHQH